MSKTRGKTDLPKPAADQKSAGAGGVSFWGSPAAQWGITGFVAVAFLAYLTLFFGQKLAENSPQSRLALFGYLLTPDDLAGDWVEKSWGSFMVLDRWKIAICAAGLLCYFAYTFGILLKQSRFGWTGLEVALFAQGVGLQFLSLMILSWGLFFGFQDKFIAVAFSPLIIVFIACHVRWNRQASTQDGMILAEDKCEPDVSRWDSVFSWALRIALVLLSFGIVLGAMLPPWDFDVREYHLQVPREWLMQGGVTFLPHNVYGNMPLGAEMHSLLAITPSARDSSPWLAVWLSGLTGKTIMACYGPLTALAIYAAGRRYLSKLAGLAAAAVFLSCPWVVHVCVNGLNESAFGFYLFTAFYAALPLGDDRRAVGLSGFLAGAAASCKYPAVLFVVFPLAIYIFVSDVDWRDRKSYLPRLAWRRLAVFVTFALLSCGLWYGKNWLVTGNPVYPLFSSMLDGKTLTPAKAARWNEAHRPPAYNLGNLVKSVVEVSWKDQFQSPLMIPLTLLGGTALATAIYSRRSASAARQSAMCNHQSVHVLTVTTILLLFFFAAWWLFTHRLERFLVPAIPLAALLAGAGVEFAKTRPLKYAVAGLMVIGLTYNLLIAASPLVGDNRWFVSLERLRTDEPKLQGDPSRVKPAIRWLNEHLKPDQAVLCVGEAAVFDLEMPVFYNTCFDDCLLVNWMEEKTATERKGEFRSRKIKYVYYNAKEIERYRSDNNYGYDPRFDAKLFDELVRQGVLGSPLPSAPPTIYPVVP